MSADCVINRAALNRANLDRASFTCSLNSITRDDVSITLMPYLADVLGLHKSHTCWPYAINLSVSHFLSQLSKARGDIEKHEHAHQHNNVHRSTQSDELTVHMDTLCWPFILSMWTHLTGHSYCPCGHMVLLVHTVHEDTSYWPFILSMWIHLSAGSYCPCGHMVLLVHTVHVDTSY